MDYFTDLATFLDVDCVNYIAVYGGQKAPRMHQKYLHLCSEDEVLSCVHTSSDFCTNILEAKYNMNINLFSTLSTCFFFFVLSKTLYSIHVT